MRVLYLTHYGDLYGANRSLLALVTGARDRHGESALVLLARGGPMADALLERGIEHQVVRFGTWMHVRHYSGGVHHRILQWWRQLREERARLAKEPEALERLLQVVRGKGIALVHTNSSVIGIGAALARTLGVPHVWHLREFHDQHYGFVVDGGRARYVNALRCAHRLICVSQAVASSVNELCGGHLKVDVVHNGIWPVPQATLHRTLRSPHEPFNVLCIGLVHPSKGQWVVLEAFRALLRKVPGARLTFLGGGRWEQLHRDVLSGEGASAVTVSGYVVDTAPAFSAAHVLISASHFEAFGRVVAEAMAHGIPIVAENSGAMPELIEDGVTGLLCDGTPSAFAAHLLELAADPARCLRMGEAGRARA